jgi:hypothetical protein
MRKMKYKTTGRMDPKHAVSGGFGGRMDPKRAVSGAKGVGSGRMAKASRGSHYGSRKHRGR